MSDALEPDLCIIGAGSAGLTVAAAGRSLGLSVVIVERGRMGGECLNTGCVPSKALIACARHAAAVRRAGAFGVDAGEPRIDGARVFSHVRRAIDTIAPHDSEARFHGLGATVIRTSARFVDPRTVEAGGRTIRAKRFVIATGSRSRIPGLPGIHDVPILTNESVFDLSALPASLIVLGGGPVGLELAQAFRRLGTAVTVLQKGRALPKDDPEAAAVVVARLRAEGVDIREGAEVAAIERSADGLVARLGDGTRVPGERLFVAAGREAVVEDLDCAAGGIAVGPNGIATDAAMRTSNTRVFAIGDCAGGFRFTHWAGYQGGLVLKTILTHRPHREDRARIVWCTYTDPEIAHVGLTEDEARAAHGSRVAVYRADFSRNDRAVADGETAGFVKLIVGPRGRLLGADVVGAAAGELAGTLALALAGKLGIGALSGMIAPYPTLTEALKRAAVDAYAGKLANPLVRGVFGLLRRLL